MILTEHTTQRLFTLILREDSHLIIETIKANNIQNATLALLIQVNMKYYKNSWKKPKYILENIRDISITEIGLSKETKYLREELLYSININWD